jgi:NAD(P)-dependent dehydrogenase (short-subunit alcohol dehydrogenase family)
MTAPSLADPERRRRVERNTPVGRTGQPEDVAAVVSFLLSEDAGFVSGELVAVDGGIAAAGRT